MSAPPDEKFVAIVEDDPSVRDSLSLLLGLRGYRTAVFADAESFLKAFQPEWTGCLLIDIRMPGMDGLALQRHLAERGCRMPVIVMTAHGDVESARSAFRSQAVDFLEKPIDHDRLTTAIEEALGRQRADRAADGERAEIARRIAQLTPREREVMDLVVAGRHNREIAAALAISPRTVEVHKARMMAKIGVENVADLVRLSLLGIDSAGARR